MPRPFLSSRLSLPALPVALLLVQLAAGWTAAAAQSTPDQPPQPGLPSVSERIEVTATRVPEDVEPVPAAISIVTGDELAARGATDLASALSLVAGVAVAPLGDTGPAGAVPEIWGLREFDAFLLVVDGVPWGGAFNPALPTLDLTDVDRIEVLRGSAPVLFGATSFVGVIHVIHRSAGSRGGTVRLSGGSYGSGDAAVAAPLPSAGSYQQSIVVDGGREGFKPDRVDVSRGHLLYRGRGQAAGGTFHLDFDTAVVDQRPGSPVPVADGGLSPLVPIDANVNFRGAKIDENRYQLAGGYDRELGSGPGHGAWSTTLALTHTDRTSARGFLTDPTATDVNANGFRQDLTLDDLYFDTHVALQPGANLRVIAGVDHLYGRADDHSGDFDYFVNLDGSHPPSLSDLPPAGDLRLKDTRNFSGLYAQAEWTPAPRWRFQLGGRLNHTVESQDTRQGDIGDVPEVDSDRRTTTRGSGTLGASWLAAQHGGSALWLYADYRDTFKPAALDFGPDAEGDILRPETAESWEVGAKGVVGDRVTYDVSLFQMDFKNLVVAALVDGLPGLINAGRERFRGGEIEASVRLTPALRWQLAYSLHDARFEDFAIAGDDGPESVAGNRLPFSARSLAATGLTWAPPSGLFAWATVQYTGDRFLDEENEALAPAFTTWSAGVGYRFGRYALRLDGVNLNDRRDPVSQSEFGDGQVYLMPARAFRLSLEAKF
jgi:iron complex outermembrane recepter protein